MQRIMALVLVVCASSSFGHAGAIPGSKTARDYIAAQTQHTYHIAFYAGEAAKVALRSSGSTYLALLVYDGYGNLIDSDTDYIGDATVNWVPANDGVFRIVVVNRSFLANSYVMVTN
jgi:hypothetical protein